LIEPFPIDEKKNARISTGVPSSSGWTVVRFF
jgi:hypothetical protein